jgi:hypothetical protein
MRIRLHLFSIFLLSAQLIVAQTPTLTENLFFPPMPIGSSRELELRIRGLSTQGGYQVARAPQSPFEITSTTQDLVVRGGEIRVRVKCSPGIEGDFSDEILLECEPKSGPPAEKSIRVRLNATAFRIERVEEIDFGSIEVGDSARRFILFRVGILDEPRWEYTRAPRAPFESATISGPIRRGKDTLAFVFAFRPTAVGRYRDTVGIVRVGRLGERLDTSLLLLTGSARPRPLRLRLAAESEQYDVRIGDTLTVNMRLVADTPIDAPERLQRLSYEIGYNPTLLVPVLNFTAPSESLSVRDGLQFMRISLETFTGGSLLVDSSGVPVGSLRFAVALGDAESSPLRLDSFLYVDRNGFEQRPPANSSIVNITNVWRYQDGRSRLVNPLQGTLVLDVDPNPVTTTATMRARNVPTSGGTLIVTDANGRVAVDLTRVLRDGQRDFTIAASGSADVVLPRGTYYARLAVESQLGGTLLSVVRLFIVQ